MIGLQFKGYAIALMGLNFGLSLENTTNWGCTQLGLFNVHIERGLPTEDWRIQLNLLAIVWFLMLRNFEIDIQKSSKI